MSLRDSRRRKELNRFRDDCLTYELKDGPTRVQRHQCAPASSRPPARQARSALSAVDAGAAQEAYDSCEVDLTGGYLSLDVK